MLVQPQGTRSTAVTSVCSNGSLLASQHQLLGLDDVTGGMRASRICQPVWLRGPSAEGLRACAEKRRTRLALLTGQANVAVVKAQGKQRGCIFCLRCLSEHQGLKFL